MARGPIRWRPADPVVVDRLIARQPVGRQPHASEVLTALHALQTRRRLSPADAREHLGLQLWRQQAMEGRAPAGWAPTAHYWHAAYTTPDREVAA